MDWFSGYARRAFNRYSHVTNNPLRYNNPTGHACVDAGGVPENCGGVVVVAMAAEQDKVVLVFAVRRVV